MNNRERVNAILHYKNYDKMPIIHFGFWPDTAELWLKEGHITEEESKNDDLIAKKLGFDFGWSPYLGSEFGLFPRFEEKVIEELDEGWYIVQTPSGLIEKAKHGVRSIHSTVGTLLTGREAWEKLFLPRLQPSENRCPLDWLKQNKDSIDSITEFPIGFHLGSLYGSIRDMLGVENLAYIQSDDEDLYVEIIDTFGKIAYENAKLCLSTGVKIDYAHYWEDICFKNGPLVNPAVFKEFVYPHYKKISELLLEHGVDIISLDCDGCIDLLLPIWFEAGVNTMFPIEVGTWGGNILPWREKYGKELVALAVWTNEFSHTDIMK